MFCKEALCNIPVDPNKAELERWWLIAETVDQARAFADGDNEVADDAERRVRDHAAVGGGKPLDLEFAFRCARAARSKVMTQRARLDGY